MIKQHDNILLVGLPEDAANIDLIDNELVYRDGYGQFLADEPICIQLPPGKWKLGGFAKELTEEQCTELVLFKEVESYDIFGRCWTDRYKNYMLSDELWELNCDQCNNAKESFQSLMQAIEAYNYNPYGELCPYPENNKTYPPDENWKKQNKQWQEAQENVKNWYILKLES